MSKKREMMEAEMYRAAADLLRRDGWCRGRMRDGKLHCMAGALRKVGLRHKGVIFPATTPAPEVLRRVIGMVHIAMFNDFHCKSSNDAIAALEIAADLATPAP